jgi:2-oxoglutarate dehydrogenase E2 component (dihydrolipoamide succinyltransferase)
MALVDLVMPKLGESIMEATILRWHKKPGDTIAMDETVLDIATDKVDSEVPSTAAGTLSEILFNENDVVPIGAVIARIKTASSSSSQGGEPITPASPYEDAAIISNSLKSVASAEEAGWGRRRNSLSTRRC